ncbi:MAG: hypothetical protein JO138_22480 [Acidobacteriaceae bacterium]|nr:hypothetical protein [Acidobacteriaceae bacterium]
MKAAAQTRIFGLRVGIDPKILAGGLIAIAVLLFWYNSRSDDAGGAASVSSHARGGTIASPQARRTAVRRTAAPSDRGVPRVRPVDPTHGDLDPTLRLDLLSRVQSVPPAPAGRNIFEAGPAPGVTNNGAGTIKGPIIPVVQRPPVQTMPAAITAQVNIPLKYYGFAKPVNKRRGNLGFFLDGDNVLMASEGELIQKRYLVVQLTPHGARLEDTQLRQDQTLPVMAEAAVQ